MSELKPCPFCGNEPKVHGDDLYGYVVHCLIVGCTVNPTSNSRKTEQEAIEAWNTRAEPTCVAKIVIPNGKLEEIKNECMDYVKSCIVDKENNER